MVTKKLLNYQECKLINDWLNNLTKDNKLTKKLEMSFATKSGLISTKVTKTPKIYNGRFYRRSDSDANNPLDWLTIVDTGLIIYGPEPSHFVPNISKNLIKKALKMEYKYIIKRPRKFLKDDWSKAYVILTFCRIICTLQTNKIKSKINSALWCSMNLPKKWHDLILSSIKAYFAAPSWKKLNHPAHIMNNGSVPEILNFSKYLSKRFKN